MKAAGARLAVSGDKQPGGRLPR